MLTIKPIHLYISVEFPGECNDTKFMSLYWSVFDDVIKEINKILHQYDCFSSRKVLLTSRRYLVANQIAFIYNIILSTRC